MIEGLLAASQGKFLEGFRASLLTGAIAVLVSWLLTPWVRKLAFRYGAVDDPKRDDRRVHKEPLPRWGGMAIFGGIIVAVAAILPFAYPHQPFPPYVLGLFGVGALIVVVGALDDLYQFSAKVQLLFLVLAGVVIQFIFEGSGRVQIAGINWPIFSTGGDWVPFGLWAIPITAFYLFVITKTMDTIDGIDGLASGISAIAGGTLSVIATYEGQPRVAIIAAAVAGAAIGFLRHNYNPAKIIMGTGGAQLFGFLLGCLSIVGAMKTAAAMAIIVPMLVFGIPLLDAVQVVIRRKISGVPITQADKRHIHHQLLDKGLSQRQAVWVLYAAALVLSGALVFLVKVYGTP